MLIPRTGPPFSAPSPSAPRQAGDKKAGYSEPDVRRRYLDLLGLVVAGFEFFGKYLSRQPCLSDPCQSPTGLDHRASHQQPLAAAGKFLIQTCEKLREIRFQFSVHFSLFSFSSALCPPPPFLLLLHSSFSALSSPHAVLVSSPVTHEPCCSIPSSSFSHAMSMGRKPTFLSQKCRQILVITLPEQLLL